MLKTGLLIIMGMLCLSHFQPVPAQDRIITVSSDTIDCRITRVSEQSIHFTQYSGEVKTKSTISRNDVALLQFDEAAKPEGQPIAKASPEAKWRFSVTGGGGYRVASTDILRNNLESNGIPSGDIDSFINQIKTGMKTVGQVHYMFWENMGLGADYQFYHSSGSLHGTFDMGDSYTMIYGKLTDEIYTNYMGLSLYMQHWMNLKFKFYGQVSSGLTMFREESVINYMPTLITGKAYGGNTELGIEYFLGKKISLSLSAGFFLSSISKIKFNNGQTTLDVELEKEQIEGLSRIDLGAGLIFYL